jgi:hypothetical protein
MWVPLLFKRPPWPDKPTVQGNHNYTRDAQTHKGKPAVCTGRWVMHASVSYWTSH